MDIIQEDCRTILTMVDLSPLKGKRVLITGANGLIGEYLVSLIHYANRTKNLHCKVTAVSLHGPNRVLKRLLGDKYLTFKRADLSKPFKLGGTYDYIFHAAGYGQPAKFITDPIPTMHLNVHAANALLDIAKKSKATFVFFSSADIYGEIPRTGAPIDESYTGSVDTTHPRSVYGESKRLGEVLAAIYARLYGVRSKICRISHLYGPGLSIHDTRVLGNFIRQALVNKKITPLDEGRAIKTFGYVADAVAMMLCIALYGKEMVYHVGGKDVMSIKELAEAVGRATGVPVVMPRSAARRAHIGSDPRFVGLSLKKVLGEMPRFRFTPFAEGLRRTIAWNRQEFKKEIPK